MVFRFRIAPETEAVEEVESAIIPDRLPRFSSFICSEEHRAGKDPFKAVYQTPVVRPIFRQIEVLENLGGRTKDNGSALLFDCQRRDPDRNKPILSKGQSELGVSDDVELEATVSASVV